MTQSKINYNDMKRIAKILDRQKVYVAVWKASQEAIDGWPRWEAIPSRKIDISEVMRGEGIGL